MNAQVAWNWRAGRTELVVTSQKGEQLNFSEAEWLRRPTSRRIIPVQFENDEARSRKAVLRYDIMGKVKLSKFLKKRILTTDMLVKLLEGLEEVVNVCSGNGFLVDRMLFDSSHVYVNAQCEPDFIYVPFTGMRYDSELNTPMVMLKAMCDNRRVRVLTADGASLQDALRQYVLREKVFSGNSLHKIMHNELQSFSESDESSFEEPSTIAPDIDKAKPLYMSELLGGVATASFPHATCMLYREETNECFDLQPFADLVVGRSGSCNIVVLGNPYMGRRHFSIRVEGDAASVVDLESSNGTYAFNKRLVPGLPVKLAPGDFLLVGGERFRFLAKRDRD